MASAVYSISTESGLQRERLDEQRRDTLQVLCIHHHEWYLGIKEGHYIGGEMAVVDFLNKGFAQRFAEIFDANKRTLSELCEQTCGAGNCTPVGQPCVLESNGREYEAERKVLLKIFEGRE